MRYTVLGDCSEGLCQQYSFGSHIYSSLAQCTRYIKIGARLTSSSANCVFHTVTATVPLSNF